MKRLLRSFALRAIIVFCLSFGFVIGVGWLIVDQMNLRSCTVTSGSMNPLMWTGSRVIVQEGSDDIYRNDIIAFHNPETGGVTMHIFGGYNADGTLMTRGMANEDPDDFTPAPTKSDVIGKAVYHTEAFTGRFWYTPRGLGIVMLFCAALMFSALSWMLGRGSVTGGLSARAEEERVNPA